MVDDFDSFADPDSFTPTFRRVEFASGLQHQYGQLFTWLTPCCPDHARRRLRQTPSLLPAAEHRPIYLVHTTS